MYLDVIRGNFHRDSWRDFWSICRLVPVLFIVSLAATRDTAYGESQHLHVAMLVADDLRADVMSVYGGPVATPNLERLARRGSLFTRATCGYPICHVSRTEMLTGRSMIVEATPGKSIPFANDWALWPEVLKQAGWHTVHAGKWHMEGKPSQRGYEESSPLFSSGGAAGQPLTFPTTPTGRPVTGYTGWTFKDLQRRRAILEWGVGLTPDTDTHIAAGANDAISRKGTSPIFLHVNFTSPHDPLLWPSGTSERVHTTPVAMPVNFRAEHPFDHGNMHGRDEMIVPPPRSADDVQRERLVYYGIVEQLDRLVGEILDATEATHEPWLIIFTSDQGLALGSHGLMGKQNQYEHTVNAPLIMAGPGIPQGKRCDVQCALRDLFPTCLEFIGLPIPASVEGKSLLSCLRGDSDTIHPYIFGYFTDTQRMVRSEDGWKLIWYPKVRRIQVFNTRHDPDELNDLSGEQSIEPKRDELWKQLNGWLTMRGDPTAINPEPPF